jgi:hypothetical protein
LAIPCGALGSGPAAEQLQEENGKLKKLVAELLKIPLGGRRVALPQAWKKQFVGLEIGWKACSVIPTRRHTSTTGTIARQLHFIGGGCLIL